MQAGIAFANATAEPSSANPMPWAAAERNWYRYGDSNPGPVAENHVS